MPLQPGGAKRDRAVSQPVQDRCCAAQETSNPQGATPGLPNERQLGGRSVSKNLRHGVQPRGWTPEEAHCELRAQGGIA